MRLGGENLMSRDVVEFKITNFEADVSWFSFCSLVSVFCLNFLRNRYGFGGKLLWMPQHNRLKRHVFEAQLDSIPIAYRVPLASYRALNGFLNTPLFDHWPDARCRIIPAIQSLCLGVLVSKNASPSLALDCIAHTAFRGH
jgi:hypothetical protein